MERGVFGLTWGDFCDKLKKTKKGETTMRKLTIKRQKSFVACLGKMKVYIEDAQSSELEIDGISYRKLLAEPPAT